MAARKVPSEFVPLDVSYQRDPRIRRAGIYAELLFVRSLAYSRLHKTDGVLTEFDMTVTGAGLRRAREAAAALVREGLWIEHEDGWRFRSWEKWNGTKEQATAEKLAQQAAARLTNHKRFHVARGEFDGRCEHCVSDDTDVASDNGSESQKEKEKEKESKKEKEKEKESVPTDDGERRSAGGADAPTQTLIGEWIDHCADRPPSRVIGQLSREVKTLLGEGVAYDDVRRGLAEWHRKGLHPSTLASVVHEVRTAPTRRATGTTDQRVSEHLALAARLRAEETSTMPQIEAAS